MSLHRYSGAYLANVHRTIGGDTIDIPFHGASPLAADIMDLVQRLNHVELTNPDTFQLRTGINTSMQQIQDEYRSKLEAKKKKN